MKKKEKAFRLHYYVSNGGDGSANVRFTDSEKEAVEGDEGQSEGWGESSASYVDLIVKDGKVCQRSHKYNAEKKKHDVVYTPLEEVTTEY